jgi:hypothetical protein
VSKEANVEANETY